MWLIIIILAFHPRHMGWPNDEHKAQESAVALGMMLIWAETQSTTHNITS